MTPDFITMTADTEPAIFGRENDEGVSEKYCHINTDEAMVALKPYGWEPFGVQKVKRNTRGLLGGRKENTAKHMVKLRNVRDMEVYGSEPGLGEITMINSHDRTSTFFFAVGWLEILCTNGLVVMKEGSFFKIRHRSITTEKVIEVVSKLAAQFPQIAEDRKRYLSIPMTETSALTFAREASSLRFNPESQLNHSDLLRARYQGQNDLNLWNVYNNVQRNLLAGGFHVTNQNEDGFQTRKVRKINQIDANININGRLWQLLERWGNGENN